MRHSPHGRHPRSLQRLFGPLDPVYDWSTPPTRASIESGPSSIWRYAGAAPRRTAPEDARLAPGFTPLVPAPRLASAARVGELFLKLDTANPTHSFKDRVVAVAAAQGARARLHDARVLVDGEPRQRGRRARGGGGDRGGGVLPGRPRAGEAARDRASTARRSTRSTAPTTTARASRSSSRSSCRGGSSTSTCARFYAEGSKTLAYEIAEQLGWEQPDAVVCPIASGALFSKVDQGFGELRSLGLVDGARATAYGGQAEGCSPVATAFTASGR